MTFHSAAIGQQLYQFALTDDHYSSDNFQARHHTKEPLKLERPILLQSDDKEAVISMGCEQELNHHYLLALLTCNTINAVLKEGSIIYESESPD
jgi:hypothetical protein